MVYVTGDIHGDLERFEHPVIKRMKHGDLLLVCGDFGFLWDNSRAERSRLAHLSHLPFRIAFVDGCHENFDLLSQYPIIEWCGGKAQMIASNIFHLIRGEIYTFEGHSFFAFGGGHSQDYDIREGYNWWRAEAPDRKDIENAIKNLDLWNAKVEFIITHEPPASLKDCLGVDMQQRLEMHTFFEDIIKRVNYEKWFFGKCHMDRFIPLRFYALFQEVVPAFDQYTRRLVPKKKVAKKKKRRKIDLDED